MPDRPWIFANMVASADGVGAWRRARPDDDPVLAALVGDNLRPERITDWWHMRHLRCFDDVAIGAETLREQPGLVQTPREPGEPLAPELYDFRVAHGLPREPRHAIYTRSGRLASIVWYVASPDINLGGRRRRGGSSLLARL